MTPQPCDHDFQRTVQMGALGFSGEPKNDYAGTIGRIMNQGIGETPVQADESAVLGPAAIQYFVVGRR